MGSQRLPKDKTPGIMEKGSYGKQHNGKKQPGWLDQNQTQVI